MGSGEGDPEPRPPLRNGGGTDRLSEDAAFTEGEGSVQCGAIGADDDGEDGGRRVGGGPSGGGGEEGLGEAGDVCREAGSEAVALRCHADRQGGGRGGG